jgi:endonuclease III
MTKKVKEVLRLLDEHYPAENICYLNYNEPWQLLIATILSAQCTDDRVNIVTKDLFNKYKTIESFASADLKDMEKAVKSTGFYHVKAKNIISTCDKLLKNFDGTLPSDIDALTSLDGVGRKTANVVRGHIFGIPSIVVDTHVKRISNKLGIAKATDPVKIEFELMKKLPKESWIKYNTQLIAHGRKICKARNPNCLECFFTKECIAIKVGS